MLFAPLEQFQILELYKLNLLIFDFSITNFLIVNIISLSVISIIIFFKCVNQNGMFYFYFVPIVWQRALELIITIIVAQLVINSITKDSKKYFLLIATIFNFILFANIIGLVPYSFTVTSHLYVTFTFSFSIFIGINFMIINKYKFKTFLLFFPPNTSVYLALILVPIELISYIAKPISLGVRLFINLMAGHTLLKVIVGFSWELLILESLNSFYLIAPIFTLIILFSLELGVSIIQTYVFIILTCIYLQDGS